MNKRQGYMGGGYGTNISPMDMKNKGMMDQQLEKMCSAKAGMNNSVSSK